MDHSFFIDPSQMLRFAVSHSHTKKRHFVCFVLLFNGASFGYIGHEARHVSMSLP